MSGKARTLIEQARTRDGNHFSTCSSSSSTSSSSSSTSSSSCSSRDGQIEIHLQSTPSPIPDDAIQAYLQSKGLKVVPIGQSIGPANPIPELLRANIPPLDAKNPDRCINAEDLSIRARCLEVLKRKPRYAGLVATCSPPEFYVICGHSKVSLVPHLKCLVALVYHLQSLNMDRVNIHLEVCVFTINIRHYH